VVRVANCRRWRAGAIGCWHFARTDDH
jgi:hypothetical protein